MSGSIIKSQSPWYCPSCGIEVAAVQQYCTVCLRSRPLPPSGYPQIFSGLHLHFNGIIPRTLKHPSHSAEWRMAERHGAVCDVVFDVSHTNVLVYRPGYERSDKVRLCLTRYTHIPCVPISWLLDSLLQSRQIHPVLYRLQAVPTVALPTVRGPLLPHHQHPYYVLNAEEYALGPLPGKDANKLRMAATSSNVQDLNGALGIDLGVIPDAIWTTCSPIEAAAVASFMSPSMTGDDIDDDDREDKKTRQKEEASSSTSAGIELFLTLSRQNKINRTLLEGMVFVLSESLVAQDNVRTVIEACGGAVVSSDHLETEATTVLYHNEDKKEALMIDACRAASSTRKGLLSFATYTWLEDCLMLGELIPMVEQYTPSAKLKATLAKKFDKKQAVNAE
ncbi:Hypothetical protein, putative [Bodo saltans]|uniref:BRCT domain-containing protein n=1 Tax=Bodo saltans TaxID=75058 RepID=A0A0S4J3S6_BODSA|nr:Hypothetical protein, putative [Bodo saltans]|eukprot:CUG86086.1 Hypothetical protein, putative [Bodo saltans]